MEADCVILGLLQNQWVRDPARVQSVLARHDAAFRRRYLGALLFFGSLTGKRLRTAFGDWCERIVWENASPVIGAKSNDAPSPDLQHVRLAIAEVQPQIILTFGQRARWAIGRTDWRGPIIAGPHPAARMTGIAERLAAMRKQLEPYDDKTYDPWYPNPYKLGENCPHRSEGAGGCPACLGVTVRLHLAAIAMEGYNANPVWCHLDQSDKAEMSLRDADTMIDQADRDEGKD